MLEWAKKLHGRSGVGDHGVNLLSPPVLVAWCQTTGAIVHPHEAEALYDMDALMCFPPVSLEAE